MFLLTNDEGGMRRTGLPMWAELSLWDNSGRCRCPRCGKYRKREDIPDQPTTIVLSHATISVAPACGSCLTKMLRERLTYEN